MTCGGEIGGEICGDLCGDTTGARRPKTFLGWSLVGRLVGRLAGRGVRIVAAMDDTWPRRPDPRLRPGNHRVPSPLQVALNDEWRGRYAAGLVAAPVAWRDDPHLGRYRLAGEPLVEMAASETPPEVVDGVAEALAVAAAAGDDVAARVMVQYMLPRLVVVAWGAGLAGGGAEGEECEALDTMISTVWLSLATGAALRGRPRVWKRLLRDAEYLVLQRPRRRRAREARAVARMALGASELADLAGRPDGVGVAPG